MIVRYLDPWGRVLFIGSSPNMGPFVGSPK